MPETGRQIIVSILAKPAPASSCCDATIRPGRLSAFCRLRRGLSPLPFCYLNAGLPFCYLNAGNIIDP
jgi:hypothetical protein